MFSALIKLKSESGNQSISPLCVAKLPNVLCCREEHKRKDYLIREAAEAIRFRPVTQIESTIRKTPFKTHAVYLGIGLVGMGVGTMYDQ